MKTVNIFPLILLGFVFLALIISFASPCLAQFSPYSFFAPFNPFFPSIFNPTYSLPFVSPVPTLPAPIFNPMLSPYTTLPGLPFRSAAATIITLPAASPAVTAYAPLGTLNLTPSTLVFLILYLTLPE